MKWVVALLQLVSPGLFLSFAWDSCRCVWTCFVWLVGYKQHTCICFRSAQMSYNQALCVVAVKGGGYILSCELPCVTHVCVQFHSLLWYLAVPAYSKTFLRFIPFLPSLVSFFLKIKLKIINVRFITLALLWFWHKLSIKFDILVDIKAYG